MTSSCKWPIPSECLPKTFSQPKDLSCQKKAFTMIVTIILLLQEELAVQSGNNYKSDVAIFQRYLFPLSPLHTYSRGFPSIDDYILDEYLISSQFWSLFILSFRLDGVSSRFQETSAEFEQARNKARKAKIEFETVKKERYFCCVIDFNKILLADPCLFCLFFVLT